MHLDDKLLLCKTWSNYLSKQSLILILKAFQLMQYADLALTCLQVSRIASDVKQEKRSLAKEVSKISNYGISI